MMKILTLRLQNTVDFHRYYTGTTIATNNY
jgi:hypothetical protein